MGTLLVSRILLENLVLGEREYFLENLVIGYENTFGKSKASPQA